MIHWYLIFEKELAARCNTANVVEPVGVEPTDKGLNPLKVTRYWPHLQSGTR
jgi:hypothetical protein